ncbi:unnamed protein product [Caenorhabditis nigoni]
MYKNRALNKVGGKRSSWFPGCPPPYLVDLGDGFQCELPDDFEDGFQRGFQDWQDLIRGDRKCRVKQKGMLGVRDQLVELRGQFPGIGTARTRTTPVQRDRIKGDAWTPGPTSRTVSRDDIGTSRIRTTCDAES